MTGGIPSTKAEIRNRVWRRLEESNLDLFPRPVYGRIPNFRGAEEAAERLANLDIFRNARILKVNPDSPQKPVRRRALTQGKVLITPTPRLRMGFLLVDPSRLRKEFIPEASTMAGSFTFGQPVDLRSFPRPEMIVVGSVAVTRSGARVGKGEGYSEIEYAILKQLRVIDDSVPVATTVHDIQIVDEIPSESFDVPVDVIVTPLEVIFTHTKRSRPERICWDRLSPDRIAKMPILKEVRALQ